MMEIWAWLLDPNNRGALSIVGGFVSAIAIGGWTIYRHHCHKKEYLDRSLEGHNNKEKSISGDHKRDFLAFMCRSFQDVPVSNHHHLKRWFTEKVQAKFKTGFPESLVSVLDACESLGETENSYLKTIAQTKRDWHQYTPERKHLIVEYLKNTPVGSQFQGMLFLTEDEKISLNKMRDKQYRS